MNPRNDVEPNPGSEPASTVNTTGEDIALAEALEEYLRQVETDAMLNRSEFVARYPELGDRLSEAMEGLDFLQRVGGVFTESGKGQSNEGDQPFETHLPCGLGENLGDYRLLREIGRGGMGIVYMAQQRSLDRQVALKILPFAALLGENQLQRFKNEARAAASLRHPNIVSVFGFGQERGVHYYAMELVDGRDLSFAIRDIHHAGKEVDLETETQPVSRLSTLHSGDRSEFFRSIAKLGAQAADALHFAHQQGVIHRDVKPANLLLDKQESLHVTDFGLAQLPDHNLTGTGDVMGTLRYMSPEQLEPNGHADRRTDVYSLGLTLYELLAGQPAYSAESKAALTKQITDSTPPPLSTLVDLPRDLETIIHKAISPDAIDRYQSAQAMSDDLQAFLELRSIKAKPATKWDRVKRFAKRNPALATSIVLAMTLLILLASVSSFAAWNLAAQAKRQETNARLQQIGLYARDMSAARQLANESNLLELQKVLKSWIPKKGQKEDFRGFEWFHLWQYCDNSSVIHIFDETVPAIGVEFLSEDRIVTCGYSSRAKVWSLKPSERETPRLGFNLPRMEIDGLVFHRRNSVIAAGDSAGRVAIWKPDRPTPLHEFSVEAGGGYLSGVDSTDISSDGSRIAAAGGSWDGGFVRAWDVGSTEPVLEQKTGPHAMVAFGPDDEIIISSLAAPTAEVVNSESLKLERTVDFPDASGVTMCKLSPNRSLAVFGLVHDQDGIESYRMEVWRLDSWNRVWAMASAMRINDATFTPDGDQVAWCNHEGRVWMAHITKASQADAVPELRVAGSFKLSSQPIGGIGYSPSGSRLATASYDGQVIVWDASKLLTAHKAITTFPAKRFGSSSICFLDPKGEQVAMGYRGRGVVCWNTTTGEENENLSIDNRSRNIMQVASAISAGVVAVNDGVWPRTSASAKGRIVFWDVETGKDSNSTTEIEVPQTGNSWNSTAVSPDGKQIAAATHAGGLIIVRRDGKQVQKLDLKAKTVRWSADGQTIVVGGYDGVVRLLQASDFSVQDSVRLEGTDTSGGVIGVLDISRDGRFIAAGGFDWRPKIYDRKTTEIREFRELSGYPTVVRFSPDGKRLMVGSLDGVLRLFITETGDEVQAWSFRPNSWPNGEFSLDGNKFAVAGAGYAHVIHCGAVSELRSLTASELNQRICDTSEINW